MKRFLLPFAVTSVSVFLLASCDPQVSYYRKLQNQSQYDIVLVKSLDGTNDSTEILKGQMIRYAEETRIGQVSDYESCVNYRWTHTDSMYLVVKGDTTKKVLIEPLGTAGWRFVKVHESKMSGGGECYCELELTDAMIQ